MNPAVLLADEPTSALDMAVQRQVVEEMLHVRETFGTAIIIVTHDVAETFEIADYVYMVNAGRIAAQGTPEELTASTDPYVCQFLKGLPDGPVAFHYPAKSVEEEFGVRS
jgi:phospholipid/cholesterol/gamma-HCH transport system ATP-binding protein